MFRFIKDCIEVYQEVKICYKVLSTRGNICKEEALSYEECIMLGIKRSGYLSGLLARYKKEVKHGRN